MSMCIGKYIYSKRFVEECLKHENINIVETIVCLKSVLMIFFGIRF